MIRANRGVQSAGTYYYEASMLETKNKEEGHVRLGWARAEADIDGPVGFDEYSFGYRDVKGSSVHDRKRNDEYGEAFGVGDVIGAMICLVAGIVDVGIFYRKVE